MTPFDTNKQKILLYAVGYTIANVEFSNLRITNVQVSRQELSVCLLTAANVMLAATRASLRQGSHALPLHQLVWV